MRLSRSFRHGALIAGAAALGLGSVSSVSASTISAGPSNGGYLTIFGNSAFTGYLGETFTAPLTGGDFLTSFTLSGQDQSADTSPAVAPNYTVQFRLQAFSTASGAATGSVLYSGSTIAGNTLGTFDNNTVTTITSSPNVQLTAGSTYIGYLYVSGTSGDFTSPDITPGNYAGGTAYYDYGASAPFNYGKNLVFSGTFAVPEPTSMAFIAGAFTLLRRTRRAR